jgi:hypothetical protein
MALTICFALMMALTVRVNAVKSEVRLADRQIEQLNREKMLLDTEFQTRASQQQLTAFNDVDFGLEAPKPAQYLENERQLAVLGKARRPMPRPRSAWPAPMWAAACAPVWPARSSPSRAASSAARWPAKCPAAMCASL